MTSLDDKAQAQLVKWIMNKMGKGAPKLAIQVWVYNLNEVLKTPETVKNYPAVRLGALKELALVLGISVREMKDKSIEGLPAPKELNFTIPGLDLPKPSPRS